MRRGFGSLMLAALLLLAGAAASLSPGSAMAADQPKVTTLFSVPLDATTQLPPERAAWRLLRINLAPGANMPLHVHPGPLVWHVESGTVTVFVQGPAKVAKAKSPDKWTDAPQVTEFQVTTGDRVLFPPGTVMTYGNKSSKPDKILAAVILPAGNGAPPGISYIGTQPSADAFVGISSDILGDGAADTMPTGNVTLTIDQIQLTQGQTLPASPLPMLYSVAKGTMEFSVVNGCVQVSRTAQPGPQPCSKPNSAETVGHNDGIFFRDGNTDAARDPSYGDVIFIRLYLTPLGGSTSATPVSASPAASPVSSPLPPATIKITGPVAPTPTPAPTKAPTTAAAATKTESAAKTATSKLTETPSSGNGDITQGATVYVTDSDVRLRSGPSTSADIVTGLTQGEAMVVTGPSQKADDIVWWPVQDASDSSISGYVAAQFLTTTPPS